MVDSLTVIGEDMENSRRPVHILKTYDAYHAYGDMLIHYAISNILNNETAANDIMKGLVNFKTSDVQAGQEWINLGGQLVMAADINALRRDICNGTVDSWSAIHNRYNELWQRYPTDKLHHAMLALCHALGTDNMNSRLWQQAFEEAVRIERQMSERVYLSRKKDHDNPFRTSTCSSAEEALAIFGNAEDNAFVKQMARDTAKNINRIERIKELI